jgi:hypothetical protein
MIGRVEWKGVVLFHEVVRRRKPGVLLSISEETWAPRQIMPQRQDAAYSRP